MVYWRHKFSAFSASALAVLMASCGAEGEPNDQPTLSSEAIAQEEAAGGPLLAWPDLLARPRPEPQEQLSYREGDAGVVDVWLPDGDGPHPVVVMVHGGCWQKSVADRTLMNYAAEDLRRRGLAVWNIEYRGVDEEGGGYPGTYQDVAAAFDLLAEAPREWQLLTNKVMAVGHSAGGHLAAWAAARANLPADSVLSGGEPLSINSVVVSGGLADLEAAAPVTLPDCLTSILPTLTGSGEDDRRDDPFADTSFAKLVPPRAEIISVHASRDRIAPPQLGKDLTAIVREAGGEAFYVEVPGGHVELVTPGTSAWETQATLLMQKLDID